LTVVFITLKPLGKIDWSWWWVLALIWIAAVVVVSIIAAVAIGALAVSGRKRL
jgi:hypothetical protein